jgi:hypothetical protein
MVYDHRLPCSGAFLRGLVPHSITNQISIMESSENQSANAAAAE